jgi:hypothetical protein
VRRYETFPFLAISRPAKRNESLAASSLVKGIYPDRINLPSLKESVPLIGERRRNPWALREKAMPWPSSTPE